MSFLLESVAQLENRTISKTELIKRLKPIFKTKRDVFNHMKYCIVNNVKVAEVADTAESPMEVEAIPACIVVETNELVTCGSSAKHPATNISTEEVKIHLGWAGAVNPYGASSFTCKSFPKKSEELLSSLEGE